MKQSEFCPCGKNIFLKLFITNKGSFNVFYKLLIHQNVTGRVGGDETVHECLNGLS